MFKFSALIFPLLLIVIFLKWQQKSQLKKIISKPFHQWSKQYKKHLKKRYFTVFRDKMVNDFIERSLWSGECLSLFDLDEAYPLIEKTNERKASTELFKELYHKQLPLLVTTLSTSYSQKDLLALPAEVIGAYLLTLKMFPNQNEGLQRIQTQLQKEGLYTNFNSSSYHRTTDDFAVEEIISKEDIQDNQQ